MPHAVHQTVIHFPEIQLATRDAHKFRGYFGQLFQDHSPLLHNHLESGVAAYRYPLVQYKVLNSVPTLVGLQEGAALLVQLFLNIKELRIGERTYPVYQKNIESKTVAVGLSDDLHGYRFQTLWMALNQENHAAYVKENETEKAERLKSILKRNVLNFFKAMDYWAQETVMVNLTTVQQKETQFKGKTMLAFEAGFVTNCTLPAMIGLGKSVARGFGSIEAN